jgi:hypothetical protein
MIVTAYWLRNAYTSLREQAEMDERFFDRRGEGEEIPVE